MEDHENINLLFLRSEDAIKETSKKYGRLCYKIAKNILSDNEEAEECVNDAYLGVWNAIPPTRPNVFSSFLCRITRNLALKKYEYIHAKKRDPNVLISIHEIEEVAGDKNSIEIRYDDEQLSQCINNFLNALDKESRCVFVRRYWYYESIKDISHNYYMSKSKIESMLFRTRNKLREYLKKEGYENEY